MDDSDDPNGSEENDTGMGSTDGCAGVKWLSDAPDWDSTDGDPWEQVSEHPPQIDSEVELWVRIDAEQKTVRAINSAGAKLVVDKRDVVNLTARQ